MSLRTVHVAAAIAVAVVIGLPAAIHGQDASSSVKKATSGAQVKPSKPLRTSWGAPDLQGVWSVSTTTPFERPPELGERAFLTPDEAVAWSKRVVETRNTDRRRQGNADVTAAYNNVWYDYGTKPAA